MRGKKRKLLLGVMGALVLAVALGVVVCYLLRPPCFAPYEIQEKTVTKTIGGEKRHFRRGNYKMRTDCYLNDETEVNYSVPVDADGKPLASAANIVFYVPFNGEHGNRAYDRFEWVREFAERWGCTVYSLRVVAESPGSSDPRKSYVYPESGWYPGFFSIQDFLIERFQLPPRKLYLVGQSAGSPLIQRLALMHPDRIAAGAACGGNNFAEWTTNAQENLPPLLFLSCQGDYSNNPNRQLTRAAAGTPWKVWYGEPKPLNDKDKHSAPPEGTALMQRFLLDAMAQNAGGSAEFQERFGKLPLHCAPGETMPTDAELNAAAFEDFLPGLPAL